MVDILAGKYSSLLLLLLLLFPSDDKFVLKIEISPNLLDKVASHHQGVQFFSKDCDYKFWGHY